jgi:hypothetical protein
MLDINYIRRLDVTRKLQPISSITDFLNYFKQFNLPGSKHVIFHGESIFSQHYPQKIAHLKLHKMSLLIRIRLILGSRILQVLNMNQI